MSGDADGDFPEERELEGVKFEKTLELSKEHEQLIKDYKLVSRITDVNDRKHSEDPDEILKTYNQDIFELWDYGTNDPQVDYSRKCHLDRIFLRGYDDKGTMYETYDF